MIIYTIEIQDGNAVYFEWNSIDADANDYVNGVITDRDLLYDIYGIELEDSDCVDLERKTKAYWIGEVIACIKKVNSITEADLEMIRRYV